MAKGNKKKKVAKERNRYVVKIENTLDLIVGFPFRLLGRIIKLIYRLLTTERSKRYWRERRERRKLMRRHRFHALRDIITDTLVPLMEQQGFKRKPFDFSLFGWDRSFGGYCYDLARLNGDILELLYFNVQYHHPQIIINLAPIRVIDAPKTLDELPTDFDIVGVIPDSMFLVQDVRDQLLYRYKYKEWGIFSLLGEKELSRKVEKLKSIYKTEFADFSRFTSFWYEKHPPIAVEMISIDNKPTLRETTHGETINRRKSSRQKLQI